MKNLRHLCAAVVLTLVFSLSAFAGIIEIGVTSPPPPPTTTSATTVAQTQTGATSTSTTASSQRAGAPSITETVLNLLQGVLSLF